MRTLLLADDSVTVQRVIALTFADEAFRVVTVSDGQAAIDLMTSQRPDIVLASTTMPNVNGYELASFVRNQPSLKDVPVLLLTSAFESVDPARLKASGASGVLEKPLEPTIVISRVKELLGIKSEARPTPAAGRLVTSADTPFDRQKPLREAPPSSQARQLDPPPVRAAKATSWDALREESGLEPNARSVEGANGSGNNDYLDTLEAAFDSLDRHLAGRRGDDRYGRNPAPPLAHHGTTVDPRSPGRRPATPVQHDAPPDPLFDADDAWFAEDEKAKEGRAVAHKRLAAEMGIHDVDLPETPEGVNSATPATDLDFDFGPGGELKPTTEATRAPEPPSIAQSAPAPIQAPAPERVYVPPPRPAAVAPMPAAAAELRAALQATSARPAIGSAVADHQTRTLSGNTRKIPTTAVQKARAAHLQPPSSTTCADRPGPGVLR
jgi:CheY-like chemotaxis protein